MFEKIDDDARKIYQVVNQEAQRVNNEYIDIEHFILTLIKLHPNLVASALNVTTEQLNDFGSKLKESLWKYNNDQVIMGRLPHHPRAKRITEAAVEHARSLFHNYIGVEHLVFAVIHEGKDIIDGYLNEGDKPIVVGN